MLIDANACSGGPALSIDMSNFRAGGEVTVVVTCSPRRSDLLLGGAHRATFAATATASIDGYRGRNAMSHRNAGRDTGSATVLMITLCFSFLAGSLVWLSRTVDQSLDDRANAAAVAFQAARAGAQSLDLDAARVGVVMVDQAAARLAVASTTQRLLAANGDTGSVTAVSIEGTRVTVSVTITTTGRPSTGTGSASAMSGIDAPRQ